MPRTDTVVTVATAAILLMIMLYYAVDRDKIILQYQVVVTSFRGVDDDIITDDKVDGQLRAVLPSFFLVDDILAKLSDPEKAIFLDLVLLRNSTNPAVDELVRKVLVDTASLGSCKFCVFGPEGYRPHTEMRVPVYRPAETVISHDGEAAVYQVTRQDGSSYLVRLSPRDRQILADFKAWRDAFVNSKSSFAQIDESAEVLICRFGLIRNKFVRRAMQCIPQPKPEQSSCSAKKPSLGSRAVLRPVRPRALGATGDDTTDAPSDSDEIPVAPKGADEDFVRSVVNSMLRDTL